MGGIALPLSLSHVAMHVGCFRCRLAVYNLLSVVVLRIQANVSSVQSVCDGSGQTLQVPALGRRRPS